VFFGVKDIWDILIGVVVEGKNRIRRDWSLKVNKALGYLTF